MKTYLFVLCPAYSGSTLLWEILKTSPSTSSHPKEGQLLGGVKKIMRKEPWNPDKHFPWVEIKKQWEKVWDTNMPILLEKSPPNILRAFEIEQIFSPSYFIAMIRDPYAVCEGLRHRNGDEIENAARFWVLCAEHQRKNIEGLKRIIHITYEDLTDRPLQVGNQIVHFLPELQDLDIAKCFKIHSIWRRRGIHNFNRQKIDRLSTKDIHRINAVLKDHDDLMHFYGYKFIYPTINHSPMNFKSGPLVKVRGVFQHAKRLTERMARRAIGLVSQD